MTFEEAKAKIKTGDKGLFAGTEFISKEIIKFMQEYSKEFPVDPAVLKFLNGFVPSHEATFVWIEDELYLFGSIVGGFKPIPWTDGYSNNYMVIRDAEYTDEKRILCTKAAMNLITASTTYPYWALVLWIGYIKTHWKWLLSWGGHKAEVCFKSMYEILRAVFPEIYTLNPLWVSCFDSVRPGNIVIYKTPQ